jgi:KRAB domain-containing zinc finger protein
MDCYGDSFTLLYFTLLYFDNCVLGQAIHVAKQKQKAGPVGECDVCGRTFTNSRMLRVHKDNVHGKLRPHLCNFCVYSASSRSTLKMHMRLHTGK